MDGARMVTEDMLDSVSRFIDAVTKRIEEDGKVSSEAVAATAGLCAGIVDHKPDGLADRGVELIAENVAAIVRKRLEGGD